MVDTFGVVRARRHQRLLSGLALALLALVAELTGRSLTHRLDLGRHVGRVSYAHAHYYPFLLAGVKIAVALMLARLSWRFAEAHAAARAARRVAVALGVRPTRRAPRVRIELSPTALARLVRRHRRAVERWLADYEGLASETLALVRHLTGAPVQRRWLFAEARAPRSCSASRSNRVPRRSRRSRARSARPVVAER